MTELIATFLVVALSLYVLFGGADFGGGILEATLPSAKLRQRLEATLAPVWEANHVWLIAVVVILFVGFPRFYAHGFTRLFVPINLALLAVLLRGVSFTLRKYDPGPGVLLARLYSTLFRVSSAMAPFCFGMIVAGMLSVHPGGPTTLPTDATFASIYVAPWLNSFGLLCGCFVATLFAYLASVFFFGELADAADREIVWRRTQGFFGATFILGGAVLAMGAATGRVPLSTATHPVQIGCQFVAAAGIGGLWFARRRESRWGMRLAVGAQVLAILVGWFHEQSPVLLRTTTGPLTLGDAAAPFVTQLWLAIGLSIVLAMVVPLLVWLYRVFDSAQGGEDTKAAR
jgi:cytochrome bd ubiquinol oxidase subunit II